MKFNRNVFWKVFLTLSVLEACLFLTGCTAAWITAVSAMLPSILAVANAIVAFAASLQGKTVSASTYSTLQKWETDLATEIAAVQAIVAQIKASATTTLIGQFQTAMQAVSQQFNSILTGLNVTDSATVAKFTQFLSLGIAAVSAVLALVPMALAKLQAKPSKQELAHYDKLAAKVTKQAETAMKEAYVAIVTEHTANADVNSALDALPRTI